MRERHEMRCRKMPEPVLDEMEMLDQQIAPARPAAEKRLHGVERLGIDLASLGGCRRSATATPPGWRMLPRSNIHRDTFLDSRKRESMI
jgi:hypothetical protein